MDKFAERVMRAMDIAFNLCRPGPTDNQTFPNNSLVTINKLVGCIGPFCCFRF